MFDLRETTFLESMGLSTLLTFAQEREVGRVRFIRGPSNVHKVFQITGVDTHLEWVN